MDSHGRSVAKGLTWRALALLDTTLLAFIFTGSIGVAVSIGGLELFTKTFWYYLHERFWTWISVGTDASPWLQAWLARGSRRRSLVKAVSWRIFGTTDTILLSFLLTGKLGVSGSIGGTELMTKVVLYYLHERAWAHVRWGHVAAAREGVVLKLAHTIERHEPAHPHQPFVALAYAFSAFTFCMFAALVAYLVVNANHVLAVVDALL